MRLLFTSDLHGILPAYERFAELLAAGSYDAGVLAGDLLEEVLTDDQIVALTGIDPDQLLDELPCDDEAAFTDWENRPCNIDPRIRRSSQIGLPQLNALHPRLHLFGHVHEAAGRKGRYVNGSWIELRKFFDVDVARRRVRTIGCGV
jgi:Icc-related predicted phosphoesterase